MEMESKEIVKLAVQSLDKHKAEGIKVIGVETLTVIAEYFVIADGNNVTQVKALSDYLEHELAEQGVQPLRVEGYRSTGWIIVDYGVVIVHIFMDESRKFYDLERLWKDGVQIPTETFLDN